MGQPRDCAKLWRECSTFRRDVSLWVYNQTYGKRLEGQHGVMISAWHTIPFALFVAFLGMGGSAMGGGAFSFVGAVCNRTKVIRL